MSMSGSTNCGSSREPLLLHRIPVREPRMEGGPFYWCVGEEEVLRITKSESQQVQFLVSLRRKGRAGEGKGLIQCNILNGRANMI